MGETNRKPWCNLRLSVNSLFALNSFLSIFAVGNCSLDATLVSLSAGNC
ncbi:hypothetical protein [Agarivorans litoreus]|nr:hypothetical protein [Agarivorans litoreus]